MNDLKNQITVSLAGIPLQVCCQYKENRDFLQDYRTDREPLFSVDSAEADMEQIRNGVAQIAEKEGEPERVGDMVYLENTAIHDLIAKKLAACNVLIFHGSALCMDGKAYIFTAPSGTGKSTHSRIWRETFGSRVWMINDDKPMIRIEDGLATVYGSPWDGKHGLSRNASAPLKAILRIYRSNVNRIEPMLKTDAFQMLLRQGYYTKTTDVVRQVLDLKRKLLHAAAFYRLYCNMEREAALTAWRELSRL